MISLEKLKGFPTSCINMSVILLKIYLKFGRKKDSTEFFDGVGTLNLAQNFSSQGMYSELSNSIRFHRITINNVTVEGSSVSSPIIDFTTDDSTMVNSQISIATASCSDDVILYGVKGVSINLMEILQSVGLIKL